MKEKIARYALYLLILGNVVDTVCTTLWLEAKLASEHNPVMAAVYEISPKFFAFFKCLAMPYLGLLLYKYRENRWVTPAIATTGTLYGLLALFYLYHLLHYLAYTLR